MLNYLNITKLLFGLFLFSSLCSAMIPEEPWEFCEQVLEVIDCDENEGRHADLCNLSLVSKFNRIVVARWRVTTMDPNVLDSRYFRKSHLPVMFSVNQIPEEWIEGISKSMKTTFKVLLPQINECCSKHLTNFARSGDEDNFKILAYAGGNPNVHLGKDDSRTALHLAMQEGNAKAVKLLLSLDNTDVNANERGRSPLITAMFDPNKSDDALSLLLKDARLNVNVRDNNGCTALHHTDNAGFIYLLLKHPEIDLRVKDNSGRAPLHTAASNGHLVSLLFILNNEKCDIYERTKDYQSHPRGDTALHQAAASAQLKAMKMLIEKGYDVNITNNYGETPLYSAVMSSYYKSEMNPHTLAAVELLLNHPDIDVTKGDILEVAFRHKDICPNVNAVYNALVLHPKFVR